jgi:hypothetical protein
MPDNAIDDLSDERKLIEESHSYVRTSMTLWVQWFTFFITINYLGLGWFAQELVKSGADALKDRRPLTYIAALLICQCSLGVWMCLLLRKWFLAVNNDLVVRYSALPIPPQMAPSAVDFYRKAIIIGTCALITLIVGWGCLALWP